MSRLRPATAWLIGAFALLGTAAQVQPAFACQPVIGSRVPTNFDLVSQADAVVVATALPLGEKTGTGVEMASFRVDGVIKGPAPAKVAFGYLVEIEPSDPHTITAPHPSSFRGSCIRMQFEQGGQYVLFLKRTQAGDYTVSGGPFTRVAEDYAGEDSLWSRAVRTYAKVQAENRTPADQAEALKAMLPALRDRDPPLADDIEIHLRRVAALP